MAEAEDMFLIHEEKFEVTKKFCDENRMSYREFFVKVTPKLFENKQLKKQL